MINFLLNAPRPTKRFISVSYDLIAIPVAIYLALALRYGTITPRIDNAVISAALITTFLTLTVFVRLGLYRAVVRFMAGQAFTTMALGIAISAIALASSSFFTHANVPRSSLIIYFFTAFALLGTPRLFIRSIVGQLSKGQCEPVLIYGAGQQGVALAKALAGSDHYRPFAFIDDDNKKQNMNIGSDF